MTNSDLITTERANDIEFVQSLESLMLAQPQVQIPTSHILHGSMYARTIFIPAGTALTGALSKVDNICVVCGDISVTTSDGVVRLTGYNVLTASRGFKRIGLAHSDTYFTTIFHTECEGVSKAEDAFTDEASKLQTRCAELDVGQTNKEELECHL